MSGFFGFRLCSTQRRNIFFLLHSCAPTRRKRTMNTGVHAPIGLCGIRCNHGRVDMRTPSGCQCWLGAYGPLRIMRTSMDSVTATPTVSPVSSLMRRDGPSKRGLFALSYSQIRIIAAFAEVIEREILVAAACNHPNCLVLPFRFPMVRAAA